MQLGAVDVITQMDDNFTDLSASYTNLSAWSDYVLPGIQHASVCWVRNAEARDLTLTTRLFPLHPLVAIPGAEHDGAGIALRSKDPDNYSLLRAVSLEKRVRFYKVERGKRSTLVGRNLEVAIDQWHTLALRARGELFTAYIDGKELFSHWDRTYRHAGSFGLGEWDLRCRIRIRRVIFVPLDIGIHVIMLPCLISTALRQ